ncbi:PaaI family thioesterase [Pseudooceanicola onchidii]|uniref:PaaI family thioesterase n=1 Tax=Pseudooceanicola onchidii TaxID=2562279 RepID=UPI0010AAFF3D|nr:PaaI family thioesterase [Pseudooceanicola onchidii]
MYDWNDPDLVDRLTRSSANQGFNQWLGITPIAVGNGQVELTVRIRPEMTQHHGYVHGGCVGTIADAACAWAGVAATGADVVTANYTLHFLAPATGELLRAKGRTIRAGRSVVTVEAEVWAEAEGRDPKKVAVAMASIAVLPQKTPA